MPWGLSFISSRQKIRTPQGTSMTHLKMFWPICTAAEALYIKRNSFLSLSAPGTGGGETEGWSGMRCLKKWAVIYLPPPLGRPGAGPRSRRRITTSIKLRYVEGRALRAGIMTLDRGDFFSALCRRPLTEISQTNETASGRLWTALDVYFTMWCFHCAKLTSRHHLKSFIWENSQTTFPSWSLIQVLFCILNYFWTHQNYRKTQMYYHMGKSNLPWNLRERFHLQCRQSLGRIYRNVLLSFHQFIEVSWVEILQKLLREFTSIIDELLLTDFSLLFSLSLMKYFLEYI